MRLAAIVAAIMQAIGVAAVAAAATPLRLHVDYTLGQIAGANEIFSESSDRSWTTFDPDGGGPLPTGPHLNAVAIYIDGIVAGAVIDNPARRTMQAPSALGATRPMVYVRTLFLQAPWRPGTAYAAGAKISGFTRHPDLGNTTIPAYPNTAGYWTCTRAGTSGQVEPLWTPKVPLPTGWTSSYAAISPSPWVEDDFWSPDGTTYHIAARPWASILANVSVSPGGALQVLRRDDPNDYYVYLAAGVTHGPQYVSRLYDPDKIYHYTVATKVVQDPPGGSGAEWTYTEDASEWVFEGQMSGVVTVKQAMSGRRYVEQGSSYLRGPQ